MKKLLFSGLFLPAFQFLSAQQLSYMDPAQAYNRLLIEKNNAGYMRIGNYRVIGTPFLYGGDHQGKVFGKGERGSEQILSYNTYEQQVAIKITNSTDFLVKEAEMVDSFFLKTQWEGKNLNLYFINAAHAGSKEKGFFQVLSHGRRFELYKKYKSSLGYVSTNYIQPELRQFDLEYEYYYRDTTKNELKKIRMTSAAIKKEFKGVKDISSIFEGEDFAMKQEEMLSKVFYALNQ